MNFSKKILQKLKINRRGEGLGIEPIPKSGSIIRPGDVLIFNYRLNNVVQQRTVVAVRPVEKDAATGNTLLTCVKVNLEDADLTPAYIKSIYSSQQMYKQNQYRTYIMSRIIGNVYRFASYEPTKRKGK